MTQDKKLRSVSAPFVVSIVIAAIYFAVWTYIDILQYESYNLNIWDVGVNFFLPYQTSLLHFSNSIPFAVSPIQPQIFIYFIMTPFVRIFPSPMTVVIIELFLFASSGVFIFLISNKILNNVTEAILLEFCYLFNFALFGAAFFPSHFQNIFSTFFAISFYFFLVDRKTISAIFLFLSALCSNLAAITVLLFVSYLVLLPAIREIRFRNSIKLKKVLGNQIHSIIVGILTIAVLLFTIHYYGFQGFLSGGHISSTIQGTSYSVISGIIAAPSLKITYFLILILPFGVGIIWSRYSFLIFPYVVLLILSPFTNYEHFVYQYTFNVGALLFILLVDRLRTERTNLRHSPKIKSIFGVSVTGKVLTLFLTVMFLNLVLLPFGPLNQFAGPANNYVPFNNYNLVKMTTVTENDRNLTKMIGLIPLQSSVLGQENMPQITNRRLWFEPGMYNGNPPVTYVIADPYSNSFTFIPPPFIGPYPIPMYEWFNVLYGSGNYGMYSLLNGVALLKLGYNGAPLFYSPFNLSLSSEKFTIDPDVNGAIRQNEVSVSNITDGDYAYASTNNLIILPPGHYNVTFFLSTSNLGINNHAFLAILSQTNNTLIGGLNFTGNNFNAVNTVKPISLEVYSPHYYISVYLSVYNTYWNGTLNLHGVSLNQTSL